MPPSLPPTDPSRRALLAGLALGAGAVATGCTIGDGQSGATSREPGGRPSGSGEPASVDPDVTLAAEALSGQRAVLEALEATLAQHRALRGTVTGAFAVHQAHVRLLAKAAPEPEAGPTARPGASDRYRVPKGIEAAARRLVAVEQKLSTTAEQQSSRAESGAFARLLASMAAAAAQQAVLFEVRSASLDAGAAQ